MQNFCIAYKGILNKNQLFCDRYNFRLIEKLLICQYISFSCWTFFSGDQQLCAQIEHNQIDLVIFLREAENPLAHEPDSDNICKLCDMYNIPLATNLATAELLVKSLERGDMEWREIYQ